MAIELAGIPLEKLTHVQTMERARYARHAVPGMSGELVQDLGRPGVVVRFNGIFYGADAADNLKALRDPYLGRQPVDFICEIAGRGYFTEVVIEELRVVQRAGFEDQFDYACEVAEYVPPPPPPAPAVLDVLDADILSEAMGSLDDIQNAIGQVADLAGLLAGASSFADPTSRLPAMLSTFTDAAAGASGTIGAISELL